MAPFRRLHSIITNHRHPDITTGRSPPSCCPKYICFLWNMFPIRRRRSNNAVVLYQMLAPVAQGAPARRRLLIGVPTPRYRHPHISTCAPPSGIIITWAPSRYHHPPAIHVHLYSYASCGAHTAAPDLIVCGLLL